MALTRWTNEQWQEEYKQLSLLNNELLDEFLQITPTIYFPEESTLMDVIAKLFSCRNNTCFDGNLLYTFHLFSVNSLCLFMSENYENYGKDLTKNRFLEFLFQFLFPNENFSNSSIVMYHMTGSKFYVPLIIQYLSILSNILLKSEKSRERFKSKGLEKELTNRLLFMKENHYKLNSSEYIFMIFVCGVCLLKDEIEKNELFSKLDEFLTKIFKDILTDIISEKLSNGNLTLNLFQILEILKILGEVKENEHFLKDISLLLFHFLREENFNENVKSLVTDCLRSTS